MSTATLENQLINFVYELKEGKKHICKLKRLNEELESSANLQEFWDISPDLFAVISPYGDLTAINDAWVETFGYSKQELLKKNWIELVDSEDMSKTVREIEDLKNNNITRLINRCVTKSGKSITLEWNMKKLENNKCYVIARVINPCRKEVVEKYCTEAGHGNNQ